MICGGVASHAQVRIGIAYGPSGSLKPKTEDTAFFGRKYNNFQLRLGIHKGRAALVFTGGVVNQKAADISPKDVLTGNIFQEGKFTGGEVRNTFFTLGPELCFPVGKIRFNLHVSGGMGWVKAKTTTIVNAAGAAVYQNTPKENSNTTGIIKTGMALHYYFTEKVAFSLFTDYMGYSLKYINSDRRFGALQSKPVTQPKSLLNLSGGLTYKF
jgi:hypothetical protein